MGLTACVECGTEKTPAEFPRRDKRTTVQGWCKACLQRMRMRRSRAKKPEVYQAIQQRYDLKRHFGISPEEYERILGSQGGRCAICRAWPFEQRAGGRRLAVDHDHKTGAVRGLLCGSCNRAIGQLDENAEWLTLAAIYLRRH